MDINIFAYIALAFLFISLIQRSQWRLRQYGIVSALFYILAYYNDTVLLATNLVILIIHCHWLFNNRPEKMNYIEIAKVG